MSNQENINSLYKEAILPKSTWRVDPIAQIWEELKSGSFRNVVTKEVLSEYNFFWNIKMGPNRENLIVRIIIKNHSHGIHTK